MCPVVTSGTAVRGVAAGPGRCGAGAEGGGRARGGGSLPCVAPAFCAPTAQAGAARGRPVGGRRQIRPFLVKARARRPRGEVTLAGAPRPASAMSPHIHHRVITGRATSPGASFRSAEAIMLLRRVRRVLVSARRPLRAQRGLQGQLGCWRSHPPCVARRPGEQVRAGRHPLTLLGCRSGSRGAREGQTARQPPGVCHQRCRPVVQGHPGDSRVSRA